VPYRTVQRSAVLCAASCWRPRQAQADDATRPCDRCGLRRRHEGHVDPNKPASHRRNFASDRPTAPFPASACARVRFMITLRCNEARPSVAVRACAPELLRRAQEDVPLGGAVATEGQPCNRQLQEAHGEGVAYGALFWWSDRPRCIGELPADSHASVQRTTPRARGRL
jgi:hypothetical protein